MVRGRRVSPTGLLGPTWVASLILSAPCWIASVRSDWDVPEPLLRDAGEGAQGLWAGCRLVVALLLGVGVAAALVGESTRTVRDGPLLAARRLG